MNTMNLKRGFAPLLVLLIIVLIGGGSYYAVKKSRAPKANVESKTEVTTKAPEETQDESGNISLKALFSLSKDTKCTFTHSTDGETSSGTVYISGAMMRGDFNSNTKSSGPVESHMIRTSGDVYVWSGTNGSKMSMDMMSAKPTGNAKTPGSFDVDQKLDYRCVDWKKDASVFALPTTVKFIDLKAMMQGKVMAH